MFKIGDYVETRIEGPVIGFRDDERGVAYKVRYEDAYGTTRARWIYEDELLMVDEGDGGEGDDCEQEYIATAAATLH